MLKSDNKNLNIVNLISIQNYLKPVRGGSIANRRFEKQVVINIPFEILSLITVSPSAKLPPLFKDSSFEIFSFTGLNFFGATGHIVSGDGLYFCAT